MPDFLLLMHNDTRRSPSPELWQSYIEELRGRGVFNGGSSIGSGSAFRKGAPKAEGSNHLGGYIRVQVGTAEEVHGLLLGNPVFENGGTVEILELPAD
jgi:hypothetical protein